MAQLSQNPPEGIVPQIWWCIQWIFQLRGRTTSGGGGGGIPTLTSTYIGYGDPNNLLTGSGNFTYNGTMLNLIIGSAKFQLSEGFFNLNAGPNSTVIQINDSTQLITLTNVPTYASDALAIAAGLSTGNLYKSTTAGVTNLHIVP